jgi:hypothetical protein
MSKVEEDLERMEEEFKSELARVSDLQILDLATKLRKRAKNHFPRSDPATK